MNSKMQFFMFNLRIAVESITTKRVYLHQDTTLPEANINAAISYLYEDIGNCAAVTESCTILKYVEITGFFSIEVTLISHTVPLVWPRRVLE